MKVYIGSYTEDITSQVPNGSRGIYICDFDESTGTLKLIASEDTTVSPSFLNISNDHKLLVAASERLNNGALVSYEIRENGLPKYKDRATLSGIACCFVSMPEGRSFAAAVHYGSGEVFTFGLDENGMFTSQVFSHFNEGSGPNTVRQEGPHCHSCRLMESRKIMVLCDLGNDTVSFWSYNQKGEMMPDAVPAIRTPPGTGPRHCEFTADGSRLYIAAELSSEVLVYELVQGKYRLTQRISTLPEGYEGTSLAADIHFGKQRDRLYVSNRGNDSIAVYDIREDGMLRLAGFAPTGGGTPRNFAVTGRYLISANQDSGQVIVQRLDDRGIPGEITSVLNVPAAACVIVAE